VKKIFSGTVKRGKFIPTDMAYWTFFSTFEGKEVDVAVGPKVKSRSLPQNKYLNGVVYKLLSDHFGMTRTEVHDTMRSLHLTEYRQGCPPVVKSTTDLSTVEFEEYCTNIRVWASEQGLYIPTPNEVEL